MKTKLLTALCALTLLSTATPAGAAEDKSLDALADVALVRPGCFVATVGGAALFVVCLPFAAMSRSVKKTAHNLVTVPARATFTRPVGDFSSLED
ncbi:MAG TPA: hypothetical protein VG938_02940 [Verrucomicrobiae bacterium]|jgi:hypothetical protein|nr:hypothetical protein [Verrucomicrobiae bacterium]